jgi:DNA adenine methylase
MTTTTLKPLFKWTGGKTKMRHLYKNDFFPEQGFNKFIDCFYGGGSISHWVLEKYPNTEFIINDQNTELIQMYEVIRDNYDDFMTEVQLLETQYLKILTPFSKQVKYNTTQQYKDRHVYYNKVKMDYINGQQTLGRIKESAYLYFLMKTSFNGWWKIYSYSKGRYATPAGLLSEKTNFIDPILVKQHSEFFKNKCTILNGDFEIVKPYIDENTYVYFDPPYRDSSTAYTTQGFNDAEQIRLCNFFKYIDSIGAKTSLSNKEIGDGFFYLHLGQFDIKIYNVLYTAGRGVTTNKVQECLVRNFTTSTTPLENLFSFAEMA